MNNWTCDTLGNQKFCNILSYFVFQIFQYLFTRPSLWRCLLMVLYEGPNSADNVRVLELDCGSTILTKVTFSTKEDFSDLGLSLR